MKFIYKFCSDQRWKIMRICATQVMLALVICGVSIAHNNYGQLLDHEVTLSLKNVSFGKALTQLEEAANVKFAYSPELLDVKETVSIEVNHKPLREILDQLLSPLRIKYFVHPDGITISFKRMEKIDDEIDLSPPAKQQSEIKLRSTISGTVTDAAKQPMAGVNIVLKGSTNGTTTDISGAYSIEANESDVLTFSFIGFETAEVKIGKQTLIDVMLNEDVKSLSEVIVNVGYWEVKEKEQTGNVSRLAAAEIQKQTINNPLQALQGRLTGVYIQQNTGVPGGGFNIQIRGQNSLRNGLGGTVNGNLPLYLIDGVPFTSTSLTSSSISSSNLRGGNPLSMINPNDIESIEVLKDADATAIYGSRGANGVVLITTKKAKAGKTKLNLDVYHGIGQVARSMDLLNTKQYITMRKEALKNDGYEELLNDPEYDIYWPDLKIWDTTRYTNWQKKMIGGTAHVTNAQFTFSGGNAKTQFLIGGGYYRESTVFPGSNAYQRGSGKMSINHESENKKFRISGNVNYSASFSDIPGSDFTYQAITLSPNAPALFDENGNLNWEKDTWINPLSFLKRKYTSKIENLVSNASIGYEVLQGLTIKSNLGFTKMDVNELSINPLSAYSPENLAGRTGFTNVGENTINTWIAEPQIDYVKQISNGTLSALIGTTFQQTNQSGQALEATGYTNDALLENIDAASEVNVSEVNNSNYKYAALFSRLNYNWKEKYIINLTGRRDGSSRFGSGNRFANFGAIGGAWIFSNEEFLRNNINFLSFGKLRTSYGVTGSDAIGNYQYLETYSPTTYPYNNSTGLTLARLANPNYSWETNRKFEIGLETGFIEDRLFFTASYYFNRSTGQLVGLPLPVMTGQSSVQYNLPSTVQNEGWEFQLNTTQVKKKNFQWSSSFNITLPFNTLIEFPDIEKFPSYDNRFDVGHSIYRVKAFQYTGVDPQTGRYTFTDINNDGIISSPLDVIGLNKVAQKFYGGLGNTLKYKNVQLDFFFQFVKQTGYDYTRSFGIPGDISNQPVTVMNRWRTAGDVTDFQRFTFVDPDASVGTAYSQHLSSDHVISDASFIRLKNVSLSWMFPEVFARKLKMEGSRIYLQGQNLLTFTKYIGLDPETQNSQSLPPLRMITAGIQITL